MSSRSATKVVAHTSRLAEVLAAGIEHQCTIDARLKKQEEKIVDAMKRSKAGITKPERKLKPKGLDAFHGSLIDYIEILIRILRSDANTTPHVDFMEDGDFTYAETRSLTLKAVENLKNELKGGTIGTPNYQTTTQWNNWIAAHMSVRVPNGGLTIITSIKPQADEIWHTRGQKFVPLD